MFESPNGLFIVFSSTPFFVFMVVSDVQFSVFSGAYAINFPIQQPKRNEKLDDWFVPPWPCTPGTPSSGAWSPWVPAPWRTRPSPLSMGSTSPALASSTSAQTRLRWPLPGARSSGSKTTICISFHWAPLGRFSHRVTIFVEMWLCAIGCFFF